MARLPVATLELPKHYLNGYSLNMPLLRKNARIPSVTIVDRHTLTPDAGLLLIEALCRKLEFWTQINEADEFPKIRTEQLGARQSETAIAQLLFSVARGGVTLAEAATLRYDPLLLRLIGLRQAADEDTLKEWLAAQTESSVKTLRRLNARMVAAMLKDSQIGCKVRASSSQASESFDVVVREKCWALSDLSPITRGRLNSDELCWRTLAVGPFLCDGLWSVEPNTAVKWTQLKELLDSHCGIWAGRKPYFSCDNIPDGGAWRSLMNASGFGLWTVEADEYTVRTGCNFDRDSKTNKWVPAGSGDSLFEKYCTTFPTTNMAERVPGSAVIARGGLNSHGIAQDRFLVAQSGTDLSPESIFARHCETKPVMNEMMEDLNLHRQLSLPDSAREAYFVIASMAFNLLTALKLLLQKDGRDWTVREIIRSLIATPGRLSSSGNYQGIYLGTTADWTAGLLELIKSHFNFSPRRRTIGR